MCKTEGTNIGDPRPPLNNKLSCGGRGWGGGCQPEGRWENTSKSAAKMRKYHLLVCFVFSFFPWKLFWFLVKWWEKEEKNNFPLKFSIYFFSASSYLETLWFSVMALSNLLYWLPVSDPAAWSSLIEVKRCHRVNASVSSPAEAGPFCLSLLLPRHPLPMAKCAVSPHAALPGSPSPSSGPCCRASLLFLLDLVLHASSSCFPWAWSSTSSLSRVFKSLPQPTPLCHCPFSSPLHRKLLPASFHWNCSSRSPGACAKPKRQDSIPVS